MGMKTTLRPGLVHESSYRITESRGPPRADGAFMVRLVHWACMEAVRPHLGAAEHSVEVDHRILRQEAAPAGLVARVEVMVEKVESRRICFRVVAYDGDRAIGEGTHERFVIDREAFSSRPPRARARVRARGSAAAAPRRAARPRVRIRLSDRAATRREM
jgi:fluoroacetyl-CoA thioesterase